MAGSQGTIHSEKFLSMLKNLLIVACRHMPPIYDWWFLTIEEGRNEKKMILYVLKVKDQKGNKDPEKDTREKRGFLKEKIRLFCKWIILKDKVEIRKDGIQRKRKGKDHFRLFSEKAIKCIRHYEACGNSHEEKFGKFWSIVLEYRTKALMLCSKFCRTFS